MKKSIITILIIVISLSSFSQDDCDCEQALNQLIEKVESDYPGFKEKTTYELIYSNFKEGLKGQSKIIQEKDCFELLETYLGYFKDGHIVLSKTGNEEEVAQPEEKDSKTYSKIKISKKDFIKYISSSTDELEGVWKSGAYKVGIIKKDNEYQAFIIESDNKSWKANQVKFSLMNDGKVNYFMGDHSLREDTYELLDGALLSFKKTKSVFLKEMPKPTLTENEIQIKMDEIEGFYFKKLTDKTVLLRMSSFEQANVERIENLIDDNIDLLENCENLIIDIRDNPGGTGNAYEKLLPYICTNNIRSLGTEWLATPTVIETLQHWIDITPDEQQYAADKKMVTGWIKLFKANVGEFVNPDSTDVVITEVEIAEHSPEQVIILANKMVGSQGEAFAFSMKQSKKVKILGTPTYGALDYASAYYFEFGCDNYKLLLPAWRARRLPDYPIDNIGVQPDIYLDESVKDWIKFALNYLEK
jgi:Peptidase family S41